MPEEAQPPGLLPRKYLSRYFLPLFMFSVIAMNAPGQDSGRNSFTGLRMNEVNIHAVRHFLANFSPAAEVHWSREDLYYVARFHSGRTTDKAYYKINGSFAFCIKYYLQDALDGAIKSAIFEDFPGCKIMLVTEFSDQDGRTFIVNIKTGDFIKTLRCNEDGIEITESMNDAGI